VKLKNFSISWVSPLVGLALCLFSLPFSRADGIDPDLFNSSEWSTQCDNIIAPDGTLGPWGKYLETILQPDAYPILFDGELTDLDTYCPRFSQMNPADQEEFWVYLIASVAFKESSCNPKVSAPGVDGNTASGLLQMAVGKESEWGCPKNMSSTNPDQNLNCGLKIMVEDFDRNHTIFAKSGKNYYQSLHTNTDGAAVRKRLANYEPCH
jgi:hypothetical protein